MINVEKKNLLSKQHPCISQLPSIVNFHKEITLMKLFELLNILEKKIHITLRFDVLFTWG